MAYNFYFNKMLLPVPPEKMSVKVGGNNKTFNLINEGEINVIKKPGLTELEFDILLPNVRYGFATYLNGFHRAYYYLNQLEKLKSKSFQFIVTRTLPNGTVLFATNMTVTLEEYTIEESAENGLDVVVSVKLKQYIDYDIKTVKTSSNKKKTSTKTSRKVDFEKKSTKQTTYTVKKGDCLWNIAKKYYGDGSKYTVIYNANKDKIKNPNLIYVGQKLVIPASS